MTELNTAIYATVKLTVQHLTNDELIALNLVATLDTDPRGRIFNYEAVRGLFDQDNGMRMHDEAKRAVSAVLSERLGR
jgi:hypothetical protein